MSQDYALFLNMVRAEPSPEPTLRIELASSSAMAGVPPSPTDPFDTMADTHCAMFLFLGTVLWNAFAIYGILHFCGAIRASTRSVHTITD